MKRIIPYQRSAITIFSMGLCVFALTKCMDGGKGETNAAAAAGAMVDAVQFAGSVSCVACHQAIYNSHIHTPHYLTTRPADEQSILGSFETGRNSFHYDSSLVVVMEKRDSGFYQVGYKEGQERIAKRFDIVVGSGSKGQTYITRSDNRLFQLPVSYFTAAHGWANSPLYPTYPVIFDRPITSRCLECHSTYARPLSPPDAPQEQFDQTIIYGVDCEKCHGPAARHVAFHTQHPGQAKGVYIIDPTGFSRQQNLDLCRLCHGGRLDKRKPSFSFVSGDRLSDYFTIDTLARATDPEKIDVHGNQYGLLRASQCFIKSNTLVCTSCHDPHANERGMLSVFSQRCQGCHDGSREHACKMTAVIGAPIKQNCIDCHMPLKASVSITELLPGDRVPTAALIRSHFISIYPEETKKFMARGHAGGQGKIPGAEKSKTGEPKN